MKTIFSRMILASVLVTLCAVSAASQAESFNSTSTVSDPQMAEHFQSPPPSARPWVFWMWLRVDTSPEAITKDLEEMHAKGIEGAILYDSGVGGRAGDFLQNGIAGQRVLSGENLGLCRRPH